MPSPALRSSGEIKPCAGGTTGSRIATPESWKNRPWPFICKIGTLPIPISKPCPENGAAKSAGLRATQSTQRSISTTRTFSQPNPPNPPLTNSATFHPLGVEAGFWWGELLTDQRPVDAFSLTYDSAPLKQDLTLLGRPHALLQVSSSAPQADWFARLSDVAPDGTVTQVTGAGLNGAQRDSSSDPKDLVPNQTYSLDIEMHLATWTFPKGHRIRLAVSNALWPMVWPTPYAMTTTLQLGGDRGSRLTLPLVPPSMYAAPQFATPEASEERSDIKDEGYPWPGDWKTERDEVNGKTKVTWSGKSEETYPWGKETDFEGITYSADETTGISSVQAEAEISMALKQQTLTWQGHLTLSSDAKLLLQIHPAVIQRRPAHETKELGGNHSQGSPVEPSRNRSFPTPRWSAGGSPDFLRNGVDYLGYLRGGTERA